MLQITLQLQAIAAELEADFIRSDNLTQSNIQVHYKELTRPVIIYAGYGIQNNYFEGAQPLQKVAAEIYILSKKNDVDQLAQVTDIQLFTTKQLAANIMYQFESPRDILTYSTDPISILDDQLIGHLLTAEFIIDGNVCGVVEPPPLFIDGTFQTSTESTDFGSTGNIRLRNCTNTQDFLAGDTIFIKSDDGILDLETTIQKLDSANIFTNALYTTDSGPGTYKKLIE